jgi:hypothetical protein
MGPGGCHTPAVLFDGTHYIILAPREQSGLWRFVEEAATGTPSTTFSDMSVSASSTYSYTISAFDAVGNTSAQSASTSATTPQASVLVSQGKMVTVSSTVGANAGSNAVDGNATTRWEGNASDPQWIYVDLGSAQQVNRVKLTWEAAYAKAYKIQVSNDAATWTDVYTVTNGFGMTETLNFAPVNARYVRVYGTQRGTTYGYSLYEYQVYALPGVTATGRNALSQLPTNKNIRNTVEIRGGRLVLETASSTRGAHVGTYTIAGKLLSTNPNIMSDRKSIAVKAR